MSDVNLLHPFVLLKENSMANIEFHFDFGSPNAYLVHKVIPAITAKTGVIFEYVPVLLGGLFKATNNVSPMVALQGIENKPQYQQLETSRFCAVHGIAPQVANPHFPVNTLKMMRGATFASGQSYYAQYINAMYAAIWEQALKMDEDELIEQTLLTAGLPAAEIITGMTEPLIKKALIDNTQASVTRGNFGSPTLFVGDEMYFGKDKLRDAVERAAQ
jgi:2-hydroxychromene-2-carboxylate isomerase